MKMLIIGGCGQFGIFYAKRFSEDGFDVYTSDSNSINAKEICLKNNCKVDKKPDYKKYDIIVISVPNDSAREVAKDVFKNAKKETLIFDFCSVKKDIVDELEKHKGKGFEIASFHPMHGPRVPRILGYPVAVIDIEGKKKFGKIIAFFKKRGANVIYTTKREHDETLAIVQGLTHFSQFVSAAVLRKLNVDIKRTMEFGSPNYTLFLSLISRVVLQNPELYSQIQLSNSYNRKIRAVFKDATEELFDISENDDAKELTEYLIDEAKEFKSPDLFLYDSDRAVNAINYLVDRLERNKGAKGLFENLANGYFHYGVISNVNNKELTINEGKKKIKIGILKVRYCSRDELKAWKESHLRKNKLDYSFLVNENMDKNVIPKIFNIIRGVKFEVIDEFKNKKFDDGYKSITMRATYFEDDNKKEINSQIRSLIKELGFIER